MKLFNNVVDFLIKAKLEPSEIRRLETEREAKIIENIPTEEQEAIFCNGETVGIDWDKVVTFNDDNGLKLSQKCYRKAKKERTPNMLMAHWDVCLSSKSCFKILEKRNLSVHFLIDNDGTIFQIMDCNDIAFHAGNRPVNNNSIGVEISNAYYPKYQKHYEKQGFGPRPTWEGVRVHGRELEPFLGFYQVQIDAFMALAKSLNNAYGIKLETPQTNTVHPLAKSGKYNGIVNHYHVTKRKIDCAGLDLDKFLKNI